MRRRVPRFACYGGRATVDVEQLVAIDVHTHAEASAHTEPDPVTNELLAAASKYFGSAPAQPTTQDVAAYYRERNMAAVVFFVDDEAGMGRHALSNDEVVQAAAENADVLIPFASIDPHKGKLGVREARLSPSTRRFAASSSTPTSRRSGQTTATSIRCTR